MPWAPLVAIAGRENQLCGSGRVGEMVQPRTSIFDHPEVEASALSIHERTQQLVSVREIWPSAGLVDTTSVRNGIDRLSSILVPKRSR